MEVGIRSGGAVGKLKVATPLLPEGLDEAAKDQEQRRLLDELLRAEGVGQSLYEAKQHRHPCVHAFPSSVDVTHFAQARRRGEDPADQAHIPQPRLLRRHR